MQTIDEVKKHCRMVGEGIAALSASLIGKFKTLECKTGGRYHEVCPTASPATVCVILSAADYARELNAWLKKASE